MDNLFDYLKWMGDFPIEATGFLEADAMVFGVLSYIDMDPVFAAIDDEITLRDCLKMIERDQVKVMLSAKGEDYTGFLRLAAESRRFGELRMSDYVDVFLSDPPVQFCAVSFHDAHDRTFLVYRGTDTSLAGWREDFMISFTRTRAQTQALAYANAHVDPARKCYLIGHSKGGNEALFAAANLRDAKWDAVEHVYILDGPGLCPDVLDLSGMARVNEKATHIVPTFSIVGKLFAADITDTRIVQSSASGFGQHNVITWGIDHGKPAYAEENDPTSLWVNSTVDGWLSDISQEDRVVLVNDLFDALAAGGAEHLDEFDDGGLAGVEKIVRRMRNSSETTHKLIKDLPRQAFKQSIQNLKDKIKGEEKEPEPAPAPAPAEA